MSLLLSWAWEEGEVGHGAERRLHWAKDTEGRGKVWPPGDRLATKVSGGLQVAPPCKNDVVQSFEKDVRHLRGFEEAGRFGLVKKLKG